MSKTIHSLKIKSKYAKQHFNGIKDWELRKNDRDFKVNDTIEFEIIDDNSNHTYRRRVSNILDDSFEGVKNGWCILSISKELFTFEDMSDAYDKGWEDGARVGANSIAEKM